MLAAALASLGTGAYFMLKDVGVCGWDGTDCTPARGAAVNRDLAVGGATAVLGAATLIAAIPLLVEGADRLNTANDGKKKKALVVPYVAPTTGGGMTGVTIRF